MKIPFLELSRVNAPYKDSFLKKSSKFIDDGVYIGGTFVEQFESEFAKYCGVDFCVGVGNGLDALTLSLLALGIGPGDEVLVPAQTFVATWLSVSHIGAINVPVDVESRTANINPDLIEVAITPRTKAIIAVHLYGATADMKRLREIANRYNLHLIEDAAQAHGDTRFGKKAGGHGDIAAFSFYPSKNLGAIGDAGCIVTNSEKLASRVRELGNYGSSIKYQHNSIGFNTRLDPLQALFLSLKLVDLDEIIEKRRSIASRYDKAIASSNSHSPFIYRLLDTSIDSVWHNYIVVCEDRDSVQEQLNNAGVGTGIHYPIIPGLQSCFSSKHFINVATPVAENLSKSVLSLPIGEYLNDTEVDYVCDTLINIKKK